MEKEEGYLLIAGERRLRAHKLAKIDSIKVIIASVDIDDIKLRELALLENIQRENLNAIELANSYAELIEVHHITHEELSTIVHKSRSQITNTMRLLALSKYAQKHIMEGNISQGHAKVLVGIDEAKQKIVIHSVIGQKLSVRETENMVKKYKSSTNETISVKTMKNIWLKKYSKNFKKILSLKHKLKENSIEITFDSEEEVETFLALLKR
jgi:ParB family chromosome partitioning protein